MTHHPDIPCGGFTPRFTPQPKYSVARTREVARWILSNVRGRITGLQERAATLFAEGHHLDEGVYEDRQALARMDGLMLEFDTQVPG